MLLEDRGVLGQSSYVDRQGYSVVFGGREARIPILGDGLGRSSSAKPIIVVPIARVARVSRARFRQGVP